MADWGVVIAGTSYNEVDKKGCEVELLCTQSRLPDLGSRRGFAHPAQVGWGSNVLTPEHTRGKRPRLPLRPYLYKDSFLRGVDICLQGLLQREMFCLCVS